MENRGGAAAATNRIAQTGAMRLGTALDELESQGHERAEVTRCGGGATMLEGVR
jgi:acetyl-CoA acetyltransferase